MEVSNLTKKRIIDYMKEGKRFDNRELLEYRDIKIELGVSKNAEGSARVKLGDTEVIAGVKLEIGEPYTDHPDAGTLITTVEFLPLSSERFEPGPPRIDAIETARIVDRGVRESGFIDFEKLCVKKGEKVWTIFLDIYSLNDAGNLIDAACLAAVCALKDAVFPKYNEKEERIEYGEFTTKKLPLTDATPITMTFHKIDDTLLLDPAREEEDASEARLSIAVSKNKEARVNAIQKGEGTAFDKKEIFRIIDNAVKKSSEIGGIIDDSVKAREKAKKA
ncbi:exosome complex protein Rrp42 [Candidatus Pacearchaeota archaeon]|nr:exosome complex protein Rrp42 [Candidatus Pacearchaeota archaeon]